VDQVTLTIPACPLATCTAGAGVSHCYTATGFPRPMHAVRVALMQDTVRAADSTPPAAPRPAGRLTGRRPSDKQAAILAAAIRGGGMYELSGYRFAGDAQRRAAVVAMADDARGWMREVEETEHGTLYEITNEGRDAEARYRAWMNGDR
jgi:hypothetical protein